LAQVRSLGSISCARAPAAKSCAMPGCRCCCCAQRRKPQETPKTDVEEQRSRGVHQPLAPPKSSASTDWEAFLEEPVQLPSIACVPRPAKQEQTSLQQGQQGYVTQEVGRAQARAQAQQQQKNAAAAREETEAGPPLKEAKQTELGACGIVHAAPPLAAPQVLSICFPNAPWPPPPNFEEELRRSLSRLGANGLGDISVRLREGSIIADLTGPRAALDEVYQLLIRNRVRVCGHGNGVISWTPSAAVHQPQPSPTTWTGGAGAGTRRVLELCRAGRLLEAADVLKEVEQRHDYNRALLCDPMIDKLRAINGRFCQALASTLEPTARDDVQWSQIEIRDPKIGDDFLLNMGLRCAQAAERDTKGPASQFFARGTIRNFPLTLTRFVSLLCEADLFKRTWIKDAETMTSAPGGQRQLFSAFVHTTLRSMFLPFRLEGVCLREFSTCRDAPGEGLLALQACRGSGGGSAGSPGSRPERPGVLIVEDTPPSDVGEMEGWKLPAPRRGVVRLTNTANVFYATPSVDKEGCCDIVAAVKLGLPLSPWVVPLELVKRFIADILRETLVRVRAKAVDHWEHLGFHDRIDANPAFYKPIFEIECFR